MLRGKIFGFKLLRISSLGFMSHLDRIFSDFPNHFPDFSWKVKRFY